MAHEAAASTAPRHLGSDLGSDCEPLHGTDHGVLLFYAAQPTADVDTERAHQQATARSLGLHGRLRVSPQGLNGTLTGTRPALHEYIRWSSARLACSIDICDLRGATVEAWLNEVFNESDDTEITVSAVWHGYVCPSLYVPSR